MMEIWKKTVVERASMESRLPCQTQAIHIIQNAYSTIHEAVQSVIGKQQYEDSIAENQKS